MAEVAANKSRRATLQDIALSAGVSISTVSLVLANKAKERRITDEVIAKVKKLATELDYSPNAVARSLQGGQTHIISFFNGFRHIGEADDIYMDKVSNGLQGACGELGYDLLISCDFKRSVEDTYRTLNDGRCDGLVLFAGGDQEPLLPYLRNSRLPTVLLNSRDPAETLTSVAEDDVSGMRQVADLLVDMGHRRIAAFGHTVFANHDSIQRINLLRQFLGRHSVEIPDRWVLNTAEDSLIFPERDLDNILAEADPPTALFCWHDRLGYRVLDHCKRSNISVPDRISVIGYDGIHWPSSSHHVLATVAVDIEAIAREAAMVLMDQITNPELKARVYHLPVSIRQGTTLEALDA